MYDGMMAETIRLRGHDDEITGYLARPLGPGPFPGVVVIHHMPGYDAATKEIVRTFATHGYNALCPNLHYRALPDGEPGEAARLTREGGGVPDEQCIGDVAGASATLRSLITANGKVGVIGYCSGGRQSYLVACSLPFDAAVDCYGGRVAPAPDELTPDSPHPWSSSRPGSRARCSGCSGRMTATRRRSRPRASKPRSSSTARSTSSTPTTTPVTRSSASTAPTSTSPPPTTAGRRSGTSSTATSRHDLLMPEHPADSDVTALVRDGYDLIADRYLAQVMEPRPHPRRDWLSPGGWFLVCLGTRDSPGWFEEDFLGYGGTNWTNGYDLETNFALTRPTTTGSVNDELRAQR